LDSTHVCRRHRPGSLGLLGLGLAVLSLAASTGCNGFLARAQNAASVRAYERGQSEEALAWALEATHTDRQNPDGHYNVAACHHRTGILQRRPDLLDQAEQYYRMCLEWDQDHRDAYRGLAVLMVQQGRSNEAFELIEGWVESQPQSADARIELARLYQEFGDPTTAENYLAEAVEIQPQNTRALTALGKIREDRGETELAMRNYRKSLQSDQQQPQVAARLAALHTRASSGTSTTAPEGDTRMVGRELDTLR
jgi:tetratricopeptide (TPR) repeat protein